MSTVYTLWRGKVLWGWFSELQPVTHHGTRVGASGVLDVADGAAALSAMMQANHFGQFLQHPILPPQSNRAAQALTPGSEEEARGVPPDHVLQVRDADDKPVDAVLIAVEPWELPDQALAELRAMNVVKEGAREVWRVTFTVRGSGG